MKDFLSSHTDIVDFFGCVPIFYATLRVTGMCNLYCRHCYANASNKIDTSHELSLDEIQDLLLRLSQKGVKRLSISGGEPFCRPDTYEVLQIASDMNFDLYLSTNGASNIDVGRIANIHFSVLQVSLDGLATTHDAVRGSNGCFNRSVDFLRKVKNSNASKIGVAFSLMRCNVHEMIPLFDFLYDENLADIFSVIPVQKIGRALKDDVLSVKQLHDSLQQLTEHYFTKKEQLLLNVMTPPAIVPLQLANTKYGRGYLCEFPYSIAIDANGNCSTCDGLLSYDEFHVTSVRSSADFCESLFQNADTSKWLDISPNKLTGICSICKFRELCCGGCRVDAYFDSGTLCASDPLCQRYYESGYFPSEYLLKGE